MGVVPAIAGAQRALVSTDGSAASWRTLSPGSGSVLTTNRQLNTTAPLQGGGDLAADRTLSVADVSNTSKGVVPFIPGSNYVLQSNGAGTASVWVAINDVGGTVGTSRVINTTLPLQGGGDLTQNRTLSVLTVSNTSAGVVPAIGAGNRVLASDAIGSLSTWTSIFDAHVASAAAIAGTKISPAFGNQTISSTASNSLALGTTPAAIGTIRITHGSSMYVRNAGNTADVRVLDFGVAPGVLRLGDSSSVTQFEGSAVNFNASWVSWKSTIASPLLNQEATASAVASTLRVEAQTTTAANSSGGNLILIGGYANGASGTQQGGSAFLLGGFVEGAGGTKRAGHAMILGGRGTGTFSYGNVGIGTNETNVFGSMQNGVFLTNCVTPPNAASGNGVFVYSENSELKLRDNFNNVTILN